MTTGEDAAYGSAVCASTSNKTYTLTMTLSIQSLHDGAWVNVGCSASRSGTVVQGVGVIAPFTVMVLQLNYLLSGVIVVEVFFAYKGFGKLLYEAATFGDIYTVEACTMVAVFVAVLSQFISDVGYTLLNPRIRFS